MNQAQRNTLATVLTKLNDAHTDVSTTGEEEQEKFDNLSEGLQAAESGQAMEAAAQALNEAADYIQSAIDAIEGIQ